MAELHPEFIPETAVYTPPESSKYTLEEIRKTRENKQRGIPLPLGEELRNYFAPLKAGQVCAVIAQTSHYKSSFMHWWEREAAQYLIENNRNDEAIIHISVEECIEEQGFIELSNETGVSTSDFARGNVQDWAGLEAAAVRIATIPIYRIGDSLARADDMPNLYLSNMYRSLQALCSGAVTGQPVKPAMIVIDYLQALPIDPEVKKGAPMDAQRRLQVREDFYRCRKMAAFFAAPVVVLVQAKQELGSQTKESKWMMPGVYDGEESSAIAQRADRIITLWMPARTAQLNTSITNGSHSFIVKENMLLVKVAKQRGGLAAGKTWICEIDFSRNTITAKK
jgi:replicative DNA helicase